MLPRLQAIGHTYDLQLVITELLTHKSMSAMASGEGPEPILHLLLDRYIMALPLDVYSIIGGIDWLVEIQRPDGCLAVLQRATTMTLNREYINTTLVPLLPKLRAWGASKSMADILPPTYQSIVSAWLGIALGPFPAVNTALAELAELDKRWRCSCFECTQARQFLTRGTAKSIDLRQIGAPARRHVETYLTMYARQSSKFDTLRGQGKQGLTVSSAGLLTSADSTSPYCRFLDRTCFPSFQDGNPSKRRRKAFSIASPRIQKNSLVCLVRCTIMHWLSCAEPLYLV